MNNVHEALADLLSRDDWGEVDIARLDRFFDTASDVDLEDVWDLIKGLEFRVQRTRLRKANRYLLKRPGFLAAINRWAMFQNGLYACHYVIQRWSAAEGWGYAELGTIEECGTFTDIMTRWEALSLYEAYPAARLVGPDGTIIDRLGNYPGMPEVDDDYDVVVADGGNLGDPLDA